MRIAEMMKKLKAEKEEKTMGTAVAKKDEKEFSLVTISGDLKEAITEEMDGLGAVPFDRVKIPSGGSLAFELPGENPDEPEVSKSIEGVIIHHHPANAYWAESFSGGNAQPDCSSIDGKRGVVRDTGEICDCSRCQYNQFGSDGKRGKACKNIHRLYILREDNPVPMILALPPTSLKYLRDYLSKQILLKGLRSYEVVTKITLKKETSGDGIDYSRAVFQKAGVLTPEQKEASRAMTDLVKAMAANMPAIDEADYNVQESAPAAPAAADTGFMDVPASADDAGLPFN